MSLPAASPILEVEGLHVVFGRGGPDAGVVHAVRDVSFRVAEGAALGLVASLPGTTVAGDEIDPPFGRSVGITQGPPRNVARR
jgi:ABC-type microcin C transport system duplicated ATPase subunit YejF